MSSISITKLTAKTLAVFAVLGFIAPSSLLAQESADLVEARRAQLKLELEQLEVQIGGYETLIGGKQKEAASLERDIAIIDAEVKRAQLEIKRRNLAINQISSSIHEKSLTISEMTEKIYKEKRSLAEALRNLDEHDDMALVEMLLGYDDLSDFFSEIDTIDSLQFAIQVSFAELRDDIDETEKAREDLTLKKQEETELKALQEIEKRQQEVKEREKQKILKVTKGEASEYKKIADEKRRSAASIRSQLFMLQGSPAIPFEKALEYAEFASHSTGVSASFILGIVAQESELGKNIGQCNLPDDPPEYKWRAVMKPGRDDAPFLQVTRELGLDPESMPVSCPMRGSDGNQIGYGGAMGPAQFIPSTWVLYKAAVSAITGSNPPNPWNPRDAFVASALLLRDNGARGTRETERVAAAKYFAGGNWNSYLGRSYANQVLAKADTYQEQIVFLQSLAQ